MNIKWDELGFGYMPVRSNIRFHYENGKWSEAELKVLTELVRSKLHKHCGQLHSLWAGAV